MGILLIFENQEFICLICLCQKMKKIVLTGWETEFGKRASSLRRLSAHKLTTYHRTGILTG